jgi:DNA polymerase III epsilon subunit family exonuclease
MVSTILQDLLPPELLVDTSDRSRGIRIGLRSIPRQVLEVDCAGGPDDAVRIRSLEFAVVDVETTGGAWSRGHRVTEIAAVRMRGDGEVIDEYRSLVNPERPIPPVITALTRITGEMAGSAPRFADVAADVARVLGGAVFVAHNAMFDWHFVGSELARTGRPLRGRTLCTVRLARKVVPEVTSRSLDALSWFFDVHNEARHRAYGDARATAVILKRLLDRLDTMEVNHWNELQQLLRRRAKRRRRRANPHSAPEA